MIFAVASIVFLIFAFLLLLHHGWVHSQDDPETSHAQRESCPEVCYFQVSDVCNFKSCNHEMWIILFLLLSLVCILMHNRSY